MPIGREGTIQSTESQCVQIAPFGSQCASLSGGHHLVDKAINQKGNSLIVLDKKMVILGVGVGSFISRVIALGKSIINENGDLSIENLKARISLDKRQKK